MHLVDVVLVQRRLGLDGCHGGLHRRQPVDVPVGLPQVVIVHRLDLALELDILPVEQLADRLEVCGQLLQVQVLLPDEHVLDAGEELEELDGRVNLFKCLSTSFFMYYISLRSF